MVYPQIYEETESEQMNRVGARVASPSHTTGRAVRHTAVQRYIGEHSRFVLW